MKQSRVMESTRVEEHADATVLWGPERAVEDVAGRAKDIEQAIAALSGLLIPLAVEIEFGTIDPDTYLVQESGPSAWIVEKNAPEGVFTGPTLQHEKGATMVDGLDAAQIHSGVANREVARVRVIAGAARVTAIEEDFLPIETQPGSPAPVIRRDGHAWVAGPIDNPGFRYLPPVAVEISNEQGVLRLAVEKRWSFWTDEGRAGTEAWRDLEAVLAPSGFTPKPPSFI